MSKRKNRLKPQRPSASVTKARKLSLQYAQNASKPPSQYLADRRKAAFGPPPTSTYGAYMASGEWRAFKISILSKRGPTCEVCSRGQIRPQIHHLTYERLGKELDTDVVVACDDCHRRYHGKPTLGEMQKSFGIEHGVTICAKSLRGRRLAAGTGRVVPSRQSI